MVGKNVRGGASQPSEGTMPAFSLRSQEKNKTALIRMAGAPDKTSRVKFRRQS
jgi:hypothetical protein